MELPQSIKRIDTLFPVEHMCSVHLVKHSPTNYSVVEAGSTLSVPPVISYLLKNNIPLDAIKQIFITHAHLDHMGGVGLLSQKLPCAIVYAHPASAPHIIDPLSKLVPAAVQVYGQKIFDKDYPDVQKTDPTRVIALEHNQEVNGFQCLHTPGHAFHHAMFFYKPESFLFSGDGFGFGFTELNMCPLLCTSPSQFDTKAWKQTVQIVQEIKPKYIQPTHFDCLNGLKLDSICESILSQLDSFEKMIQVCDTREQVKDEFQKVMLQQLINYDIHDTVKAWVLTFAEINVDGIFYRVQRRLQK